MPTNVPANLSVCKSAYLNNKDCFSPAVQPRELIIAVMLENNINDLDAATKRFSNSVYTACRCNFIVIAMSCVGGRCWPRKSFLVAVYEGRLETIGERLVSKKEGRACIWRT